MFGLKKKLNKRQINSPVALWMQGDQYALLPKGYISITKNEEVRKCIHKIADLISSMTIMLMENSNNGDIRIKNELSKLIDVNPNRNIIRKNWMYKVVSDMIIYGNSVVYPETSKGLLMNLNIWDMKDVKFEKVENGYQIEYNHKFFEPSELLHFVLIPQDRFPEIGEGFIPIVQDAITNIIQANVTKTGFLQSKFRPSIIIRIETDVEGMQIKEEREKILNSYISETDNGNPWIIPASEISVEQVRPLSLQDLAIQESIELDKKAVASAFGVPSFMVGVGNFNKDEYNNFISSVIMPIAKSIEQELSKKIVYKPEWYFKFNSRSLFQYDLPELTTHVKDMLGAGLINRNEGRNMFGLTPISGLDEYIVLENYIPVSQVGNQEKLVGGENKNE